MSSKFSTLPKTRGFKLKKKKKPTVLVEKPSMVEIGQLYFMEGRTKKK